MAEPDYSSPQRIEAERQRLKQFFATFPFFKLLGIELIEVEPHRSKLSVRWRGDLVQPAGVMHGGVIATLVDTAIAQSIILTPQHLAAQEQGGRLISVDLRIKYLRPVSGGIVYCEARAPRIGRQITHATAVCTDEAGKEVATGDSIYMMVAAEQLRRREK